MQEKKLNEKQQAFVNKVNEQVELYKPSLDKVALQVDKIQQAVALIQPAQLADATKALTKAKAKWVILEKEINRLKEDRSLLKSDVNRESKASHLFVRVESLSTVNKTIKAQEQSVKDLKELIDTTEASVDSEAKKQLRENMSTLLNAVKALSTDDFAQTHDKLLNIDNAFINEPHLADNQKYQRVLGQGFSSQTDEVIDNTRKVFNLIQIVNPLSDAEALSEILSASLPNDKALLEPQISAKLDVLFQLIDAMEHKSDTVTTLGIKLAHVATAIIYKRVELEATDDPSYDVNELAQDELDLDKKAVAQIVSEIQSLENNVATLIHACDAYQLGLQNKIRNDYASNPHKYTAYLTDDALDFNKILTLDLCAELAKEMRIDISKYKVLERMKATLSTDDKPSDKFETFKAFYEENKALLESNTDSAGLLFLKVVATIFSLGIAAPWLWQKESEPFTQNVNRFFALPKEPRAEEQMPEVDENLLNGPNNQ